MADASRVEVEDVALPVGVPSGVMVRIFRPRDAPQPTPVVLYLSDAAATTADEHSDRQLRAMAVDSGAAVLVPELGPAPVLERLYEVLRWVAEQGQRRWLDGSRVALAGGGDGATLCARLSVLAGERGGPEVCAGALLLSAGGELLASRDAARFLGAALGLEVVVPGARRAPFSCEFQF